MLIPQASEPDAAAMHREIMSELGAIRAQLAVPGNSATASTREGAPTHEVAEARALLETYRAQIEQCAKLKVELDLIHDTIDRTKREIAVLHGKSFDGHEMAKVNGELGAVVGGTEQATQQILEAAESIDQAASALSKVNSLEQQTILGEEIQERIISIYEACNFQDLTGQRISKVMTTMKFIETRGPAASAAQPSQAGVLLRHRLSWREGNRPQLGRDVLLLRCAEQAFRRIQPVLAGSIRRL